ncbi:MAG: biotin--[acetyl-CoA-carboxylase] ligase [Pseudomonadota bacterium]
MEEYQIFKSLCKDNQITFLDIQTAKLWFDIFKKKGLQLLLFENTIALKHALIALDCDQIDGYLADSDKYLSKKIKIIYETNSTSKHLSNEKTTEILIAEYQSEGKGRRGKTWVSPVGHNVYLSLNFNHTITSDISFLPIYISIILTKALVDIGLNGLKIKWPNDLYLNNKKVSGSILDCFRSKSNTMLIFGVGINISMPISDAFNINQPYTSVSEHYKNDVCNRNYLLASILPCLYKSLETFNPKLINQYIKEFEQYNILKEHDLIIHDVNESYTAKYICLNKDGSLKVIRGKKLIDVYAADVSLKLGVS